MRYREQRNYGCRIHDELTYKGMRAVTLENSKLRISLLADKGTEIFEYLYKPRDLDFMWLSSNGVQNPTEYLPTSPDPLSAFLDYYPGGWQEIFPNGGPTSQYLGAQFGQHGEIAHMAWDWKITIDRPEKIQVEFSVRPLKIPFLITKRMTLEEGSSSLLIEEEIENLSGETLQVMWGHHIAYGKPFLSAASEIKVPNGVKMVAHSDLSMESHGLTPKNGGQPHVWPIYESYHGEDMDMSRLRDQAPGDVIYLTEFSEGKYELLNRELGLSFEVEWDEKIFPYVWFWRELGATKGYPWYGRHYNIGLEPFSSFPTNGLSEAVRNGSALQFSAREKKSLFLRTTINLLD